jgi:DNA adenine methylase
MPQTHSIILLQSWHGVAGRQSAAIALNLRTSSSGSMKLKRFRSVVTSRETGSNINRASTESRVEPVAGALPFLRWAGSKRKLLPNLLPLFARRFERYIEPFMGSAVLFFALTPNKAVLSDFNKDLIATFKAVRDIPEEVWRNLSRLPLGKESYYQIRSQEPSNLSRAQAAARFIYLNRFCFNGLYRTNLQGQFNVPFGAARSGSLPELSELKASSFALRRAKICCGDFERIVRTEVRSGDFVYLDPPYALNEGRIFRQQYGVNHFERKDIRRLGDLLFVIDRADACFLLSYAYCDEALVEFAPWPKRTLIPETEMLNFSKLFFSLPTVLLSMQTIWLSQETSAIEHIRTNINWPPILFSRWQEE